MIELLKSLQEHVMSEDNILKFSKNIDNNSDYRLKKRKTTNNVDLQHHKKNFFIPYQEDKLFWIYYYIKYGYIEYNYVGSTSYTVENECKLNLIEKIKNNKSLFKDYKLKKIGDCINDLLCNKDINLKIFILICIVEKISIVYIMNNIYYKIIFDDSEEVNIIYFINNIYGSETVKRCNIEHYIQNRYEVENFEKPILSKSSYKLDDLINLCKVLDIKEVIDNDVKMKKDDIYNIIENKISLLYKIEK
jgi:hypothetical protein